MSTESCPFCLIVKGLSPAKIVYRSTMTLAFVPLKPVTPGHLLVIPNRHVQDFTESPRVTSFVMHRAAQIAAERGKSWNLITSMGAAATQTVMHFHVHIVPRREDDGLLLPWSNQEK